MAKAHKITGVAPSRSYRENARIILPQKIEEVYTWEPFIRDESRREELHNMRISIRRLRYTMEIFRAAYQNSPQSTGVSNRKKGSTLPKNLLSDSRRLTVDGYSTDCQYAEFLAVIVDLQEILGDIHDCDVVLDTLVGYKSQLINQGGQVAVFPGIDTRIVRAEKTRKADYKVFMKKWEQLSVTNFKQKLLAFLTS